MFFNLNILSLHMVLEDIYSFSNSIVKSNKSQ